MTNTIDKLNQALDFIVDEVQVGYNEGKAFAVSELPKVAEEILQWYFWDNLMSGLLYLIFFIFIGSVALYGLKTTHEINKAKDPLAEFDENPFKIFISIFGVVAILIFIPITWNLLEHIKNCIKVKVAPRVVLIQEVSNYIK